MIPTRQAYWLLFGGMVGCAGLGSLTDPRLGIASLVAWDLAVLGLVWWDAHQGLKRRVRIQRQPLGKLSIGRENCVTLDIDVPQPVRIRVRDGYPITFKSSQPTLELELSQSGSVSYTVTPPERGEFSWQALAVRQLSPWGLSWQSWQTLPTQTVAVYPDLLKLRELSIKLTLTGNGSLRQKQRLGLGSEFAELKDYSRGDDPRLIDWKATARRNRPLVRVLEPEREQTLWILLDRGRLMTAQVAGLHRFDWGLNTALALALTGLQRGDQVGIAVFDRQIHTWIPPERGMAHLNRLVERLTPIQPELLEPDYIAAATFLLQKQSRRSLVVCLTDLVDPIASGELLLAMTRLAPRHLPFCVTLRDPLMDVAAQANTDSVEGAYRRAVALDLLAQRQVAFAQLQRKGVLVLDAPANGITDPLIDQYLLLKARNQL